MILPEALTPTSRPPCSAIYSAGDHEAYCAIYSRVSYRARSAVAITGEGAVHAAIGPCPVA